MISVKHMMDFLEDVYHVLLVLNLTMMMGCVRRINKF